MALRIFQIAATVLLLGLAVAEVWYGAHGTLQTGDEVFNLDAILSFFDHGDYTTRRFGNHPFDPAISSGILATFLNGVWFSQGLGLFATRVISASLAMVVFGALVGVVAVRHGLDRWNAALVAFSVWVSLLMVNGHELRIANGGELWGFLWLAGGTIGVLRSPRVACLCWGLAVWWCKIIYLPFAGLFVLVVLADARNVRERAILVGHFVAPLAVWMLLIFARYDGRTLLGWVGSYITFVLAHATGTSVDLPGLPVLEGWRFEPVWEAGSFLRFDSGVVRRTLVPLVVGPLALLGFAFAILSGRTERRAFEVQILGAATAVVCLFVVWFFAIDPTQWGRHLMPAIYVSVAMAVYLWLRSWSAPASILTNMARVFGVVLLIGALGLSARYTFDSIRSVSWKASYAKACVGPDILTPPCWQDRSDGVISDLMVRLCDLPPGRYDQHCMQTHPEEFFEYAARIATMNDGDSTVIGTGGYIILVVQYWAYSEPAAFYRDFAPVYCRYPQRGFRTYLRDVGLDLDRLDEACGDLLDGSEGQAFGAQRST